MQTRCWVKVAKENPNAHTYLSLNFHRNVEHLRVARLDTEETMSAREAVGQPILIFSQPKISEINALICLGDTYKLPFSGNQADAAGLGW